MLHNIILILLSLCRPESCQFLWGERMKQILLLSSVLLMGVIMGISGTLLLGGLRSDLDTRDEVAILRVQPPIQDAVVELDMTWQRQIQTHVSQVRLRPLLETALRDIDVRRTDWFGSFDDANKRTRALEAGLHVQQVPQTSLIQIWFDSPSSSDSRTITNSVTRTYLDWIKAEQRAQDNATLDVFRTNVDVLSEMIRDTVLELEDAASSERQNL